MALAGNGPHSSLGPRLALIGVLTWLPPRYCPQARPVLGSYIAGQHPCPVLYLLTGALLLGAACLQLGLKAEHSARPHLCLPHCAVASGGMRLFGCLLLPPYFPTFSPHSTSHPLPSLVPSVPTPQVPRKRLLGDLGLPLLDLPPSSSEKEVPSQN